MDSSVGNFAVFNTLNSRHARVKETKFVNWYPVSHPERIMRFMPPAGSIFSVFGENPKMEFAAYDTEVYEPNAAEVCHTKRCSVAPPL